MKYGVLSRLLQVSLLLQLKYSFWISKLKEITLKNVRPMYS